MPVLCRLLVLLLPCLLLAATSCQRASYSFQPLPAAHAATVAPIHPPAPSVVPPSGPPAALASRAARPASRMALRHVRQVRRLAQGPPRGAGFEAAADRSLGPGLAVPRRRASAVARQAARHQQAASGDFGYLILAYFLLIAPAVGGLLLIFGVWSIWAIALGILLVLVSLGFGLYLLAFGRR